MKKILLFILFCGNINYFCFAQPGKKFNQAEALQVAYLTKELDLSPEEAQKFWPVFYSYRAELRKARLENADELDWEEKILSIRKKYRTEFRKLFGNEERGNRLFKAEKNFREIMKKELLRRQKNNTRANIP